MNGIESNSRGWTASLSEEFAFVKRLPSLGRHIYADSSTPRQWAKAAWFSLQGLRYGTELRHFQSLFACSELREVLHHSPKILDKPFNPYVCIDWTVHDRMTQLRSHFLFLKKTMGARASEVYSSEGHHLFDFIARDELSYRVELFQGYQNEGAMGIRLCDSQGREIYTLSFHIGLGHGFDNAIFIGALQGPNDRIENRQELITLLTRSLNGLRPKALMVEILYMVAQQLGINELFGVSNAGHIHQSDKYSDAKRAQMSFDMDALWGEYNGVASGKTLYTLPSTPERKDIASLKAKKRSLYRKRYAWLDEVSVKTAESLAELLVRGDVVKFESSASVDQEFIPHEAA